MPFTKVGPFSNGGAPYLSAATFNGMESNIDAAVSTLDSGVSTVSGNLSVLTSTVSSLSGNVTSLGGNVTTLQGQVSALQQPAAVAPRFTGTASARAALTVSSLGESTEFYETDTGRTYRVVSGAWAWWSSGWLPISGTAGAYPSGLASPGFGYVPAYRVTNGDVQLSGACQKTSGAAWANSDTVLTLPSGLIPTSGQVQYMLTNAGAAAFLSIQTQPASGTVTVHNVKGTSPTWLSLDGFLIRRS